MFVTVGSRAQKRILERPFGVARFPTGGSTTLQIGGIPQGFSAIELFGIGRSAAAGTGTDQLRIRFNGDSGTNYANQADGGNASSPFSARDTGQTGALIAEIVKAGDLTNAAGFFSTIIPFYTNPTFFKNHLTHYSTYNNTTSSSIFTIDVVGLWASIAPIFQIDLYLATGPWVVGSEIAIRLKA